MPFITPQMVVREMDLSEMVPTNHYITFSFDVRPDKKFGMWCATEGIYLEVWSSRTPTECPNCPDHLVDPATISIIDTCYNISSIDAEGSVSVSDEEHVRNMDHLRSVFGRPGRRSEPDYPKYDGPTLEEEFFARTTEDANT